jgi:hypothetical protein
LEEHGLIRVADTRIISGIIEKHYRVTAYRLSVERELLAPGAEGEDGALDAYLSLILDHARAEIRRSFRAGLIDLDAFAQYQPGAALGRMWLQLTPSQAETYHQRLKQLDREFAEHPPTPQEDETAQRYEVLIGIYPVLPSGKRADQVTR